MAEYISMKQVPGGTVTSVDDRILYDINLTNGKIYGCEVSYLGNNMIHINAGYGVIKGGLFEIEDHTEYVDFAESEPTPGQIYLHFDAAAQDKLTIVKETSATAHQLVQNEDANYESGVYEIQICTFTATTTALTDVTETWPTASGAMETLGTMEEVMANTEAGKVADALVTKQLNSNLNALSDVVSDSKTPILLATLTSVGASVAIPQNTFTSILIVGYINNDINLIGGTLTLFDSFIFNGSVTDIFMALNNDNRTGLEVNQATRRLTMKNEPMHTVKIYGIK